MDRGAWWAIVHGVTKSRTRLKQLSTCLSLRSLRRVRRQDSECGGGRTADRGLPPAHQLAGGLWA